MPDMTDEEWCSYQGVYQAYAWAQGATDHATEFRIPDEHFWTTRHVVLDTGFDLIKFFIVVAENDDGAIHYWRLTERGGDEYLTLACTEDNSMTYMGTFADEFRTASSMIDYLKGANTE